MAVAALILAGGMMSATSAKAEDLVDFLWGGDAEYGGGRSVVAFDTKYKPNQIIVSFSDRRLYLITKPGEAITYPVAVPKGDARWQGVTTVSSKRVNPPWTPTAEMLRENPRLPHWVPGGHPMNPLGIRAMYLGSSAYRIHGTDAPWTIGKAVSHGCIRMTNKDVLDLYPRVPVGMRVTVTWQHFSTHSLASGASYPIYGDDDDSKQASNNSTQSTPSKSRPTDGSLSSLFFWDDPAPTHSASDRALEKAPEKAAEKAKPEEKKKPTASASAAKKKPVASEPKKSAAAETPKRTSFVPDPVKPSEGLLSGPATQKAAILEQDDAPAALATASADDSVAAPKSSEQIQ
jgi:lipoprotein-anchoring transpeptidase ErfK/SrfK